MLVDPFLSPQRLMEVAHVAHRLSISPGQVRKLIREGTLKALLIGKRWRIEPTDVEAYKKAAADAGRARIEAYRHEHGHGAAPMHAVPQARGA